ncbi:MAG TPA: hypothetical protein VGZ93_09920 [Candidatus Methylacidiphilales bacterium]|nr:hypothetical protein [Candidatus Methylacidiphilales bacterium]
MANVAGLAVVPGTPTIHNFGNGNNDYSPSATPWTAGGIVEGDSSTPPNQTLFRKVIAAATADAKGRPNIKNYVQTDMVVENVVLSGAATAAIYPKPL